MNADHDTRTDAAAEPAAAPDESAAAEQRRMRVATAIFAAATMISRVAGYIRTFAVAWLFGTEAPASAYTIAFQIPNLIRSLVADAALGASLVPVVSELRERHEEERAWRVASTLAGLIVVLLGPLVVVCMIFAPVVVDPFVDRAAFGQANYELTVELTRIMFPLVVIMALSGVVVGLLNAYDHFASPALAPVAWNAVILAGLVIAAVAFPEGQQIYVYAVATLVGTVVQAVLPLPWLRGLGGRLRLAFNWRDPRVHEVLLLMLPVTIGLGLINLQQLIGTAFASHVPAETLGAGVSPAAGPAVLDYAYRLYMLPQGVFSVAVSTVFFPALSRYAARTDFEGFRETFAAGLRQIFVLLLPCAIVIAVLAEPIVRVLYERGDFDPASTRIVADTLVALSLGLVFNGASLLLIRSFFSLRQPWVPTLVAVLTLATSAVAIYALYRPLGVVGIALATSIVNLVSFSTLYVLLQRRIGLLGTRRTIRDFALVLAASTLAAGAAWLSFEQLQNLIGSSAIATFGALGAAVAAACVVYLGIVFRLGLIDRRLLRRRRTATEES